MQTLKEKWLDALPILCGLLILVVTFYVIIFGISQLLPTDEEVREEQIRNVESIKLCTDNNLDTYQVAGGNWYCKPNKE